MTIDIVAEVQRGNYRHTWKKLTIKYGYDILELFISADALQVQVNDQWVRATCNPKELADLCKIFSAVPATPYLLDRRFIECKNKNEPQPKYYPGGRGMSTDTATLEHDARVDAVCDDLTDCGNPGKVWVYPLEAEELYGWHVTTPKDSWNGIPLYPSIYGGNLKVIQRRSAAHCGKDKTKVEPTHEDYSMVCVMVSSEAYVNGLQRETLDLYSDVRFIPMIWGKEKPPAPVRKSSDFLTLKRGANNARVLEVQEKFIALGLDLGPYGADGKLGPATERAIKEYQKRKGLMTTGEVTENLYYDIQETVDLPRIKYPSLPDCPFQYLCNSDRQKLLGEIQFRAAPSKHDSGRIIITNDFLNRHVAKYRIPQLDNMTITGSPQGGHVYINRRVANQIIKFFDDVEKAGLLQLILSWDGLGNTRLKRGYTRFDVEALSAHSWFSAFDINYAWNKLGAEPAEYDERGTVKPLVEIAYANGIGWGGTFDRRDGMHFSVWDVR